MTDYTNSQGGLSLNKSLIGYFLIYELAVYLANDMIIPGMLQVISDFQSESSMVPTSLTIFIMFSPNISYFNFGKFLQGICLCFIGTIGYVIVQEILSEMAVVRTTSIMNNIAKSPLADHLLDAIIVEIFHWRVIFLILVLLSALALWDIIKYMPETVVY